MEDIFGVIFLTIFLVIFALAFGLILAFPIMWAWNYVIPAVFHLSAITWGQSFCINFLAGCLIKSSSVNTGK